MLKYLDVAADIYSPTQEILHHFVGLTRKFVAEFTRSLHCTVSFEICQWMSENIFTRRFEHLWTLC
jgi:hypothetical protein